MATRKKGTSNNGRGGEQRTLQQEQEQLAARLSERADELAGHAEDLANRAQRMAIHADRRFRGAVDRRPPRAGRPQSNIGRRSTGASVTGAFYGIPGLMRVDAAIRARDKGAHVRL